MKDIRLVATDLDRTLITSSGDLPPDLDSYVARLTDAGIIFVPASGRPLPTLRAMFPSNGENIGYIADNGGVVALGDQILHTDLIPPSVYAQMVDTAIEEGGGIPTLCAVDGTYVPEQFREHEELLHHFFYDLFFVPDLRDLTIDAAKMSIGYPNGDSRDHYDFMNDRWGSDYSVVIAGPVWVDVMNLGVDKGNGLKVLGDHLGISANQMMAFGDTDNDLAMLAAVEHSYAVGNADEHVKEAAKHTTLSNDDHGVTVVLKQLLEAVE